MKNFLIFLGFLSLFLAPGLAKEANSQGTTGSSASVNTSNSASTQTKASNTNANAAADVNVDVSVSGQSKNEDKSVSQNSASSTTSASATSSSATSVSVGVRASEIRDWDAQTKQEFLLQLKERVEVTSGQDLENFARGVLLKDENMESAVVNEESIEIEYRQPAKFLGIFPAKIKANVTVGNDAQVKVKFPWYRVFYSVPKELVESSIEASVKESLTVNAENSIQTQAKNFESISTVLKAKHEAVLKAQTATSVE